MSGLVSPQFSRIFSAPTVLVGSRILPWLVLLAILSTNAFFRLKTTTYWMGNQKLLNKPLSSQEHVNFARDAWKTGNWQVAKNELLVAEALRQKSPDMPRANVLGAAVSPMDLLKEWEQKPARLTHEAWFWETIVKQKPDYRDVFITLAGLHYQLNNDEKAVEYLALAENLDPNFVYVKKLSQLLLK